ncbi:MAG TPA: hypothetical protein VIX82_14360 [Solirubrobacteraceae bacterium]
MNSALRLLVGRARQQDLLAASTRKLDLDARPEPIWGPVVIRIATPGDRRSLERLAELDSTETPTGATLIGELRDRVVAALSLSDGKAIADPFVRTGDVLELLRLRAGQLRSGRSGARQ